MDEIRSGLSEVDCDVLVIGGGTAGPMTAYKDIRRNPNARATLLEKANVQRSGAITMGEMALAEVDRIIAGCRLCPGGCRLRDERAVPSSSQGPQARLGGWHSALSQGVACRRKTHLAKGQTWPPASGTFLTFCRLRLKTCWRVPSGKL
jgi:2-polyprenyl-6-methoxyphenol hydroxylase-like FAD-dependent oxidoreductase